MKIHWIFPFSRRDTLDALRAFRCHPHKLDYTPWTIEGGHTPNHCGLYSMYIYMYMYIYIYARKQFDLLFKTVHISSVLPLTTSFMTIHHTPCC